MYARIDTEREILIMAVYVNTGILACSSLMKMNVVKEQLSQKFEMKDPRCTLSLLGG